MDVRVELDAEAALHPSGDCLPQLREARRCRIAHAITDTVAERLEDRRVGRLAGVAHPEVDHLEAQRLPLGDGQVEANERVGGGRAKDRGEGHARKLAHTAEREPPESDVRPLERVELDQLVLRVRVAGRPGTEVDRRDPAGGEVRDVRPRLFRLDR